MNENTELEELNEGINIGESICIFLSIFVYQFMIGIVLFILSKLTLWICGINETKSGNIDNYINLLTEIIAYFLLVKKYVKKKRYHLRIAYKIDVRIYLFVLLSIIGYRLLYHNTLGIFMSSVDKDSWIIQALDDMLKTPVVATIGIIFMAPIFEEIIFRGIILEQLSKRYTPTIAIIISSMLFAVFHFNLIQGINAFFIGVLSGIIYVKTNSLVPCILLHFVNNSFAYITGFFPSTFNDNFSAAQLSVGIFILIVSIFIFKNINKNNKDLSNFTI